MQENNPVQVVPEVQPVLIANDNQPKTNSFLVILLSILLIISISIAGFFAFQTQKLVKELTALKTEEKVVAVTTPEPTTEPVATESSEADPTANWKTYTNKVFKFSFEYPSEYQLTDNLQESTDPLAWTTKKYIQLDNSINSCSMSMMINPDGFGPWFPNKFLNLAYSFDTGFYVTTETSSTENLTENVYNLVLSGTDSKAPYTFLAFANCPDNQTNRNYLDKLVRQILSTFKFTN